MDKGIFSPNERRILLILGRRKMTITEITAKAHPFAPVLPLNAEQSVAMSIRRIIKKCNYYGKTWTLVGTGMGRHGRTVWRAKRI